MKSTYEIPNLTVVFAKIRKGKDASGLTNQEIADKSGIAYNTVCNITAGTAKQVSFHSVAAICVVLGLSLDETLGLRDTDTNDYIRELEIENACAKNDLEHHKRMNAVYRPLIFCLVGVCAILLCATIGYVILDIQLKNIGLFKSGGLTVLAVFLAIVVLAAVALIAFAVKTAIHGAKATKSPQE